MIDFLPCSLCLVGPGSFVVLQGAGEEKPDWTVGAMLAKNCHCPEESLEVAIVVIVAHEKQFYAIGRDIQFLSNALWKRSLFGKERSGIEAMMNRHDWLAGPTVQLSRKGMTWRYGAIGPIYRPSGKRCLKLRIQPHPGLAPSAKINVKIRGSIKRISAE